MSNPFVKVTTDLMSIEKQQVACTLMLESALLTGTAADIKHLRTHAHVLLDKFLDAKQEYYAVMKQQMRNPQ